MAATRWGCAVHGRDVHCGGVAASATAATFGYRRRHRPLHICLFSHPERSPASASAALAVVAKPAHGLSGVRDSRFVAGGLRLLARFTGLLRRFDGAVWRAVAGVDGLFCRGSALLRSPVTVRPTLPYRPARVSTKGAAISSLMIAREGWTTVPETRSTGQPT